MLAQNKLTGENNDSGNGESKYLFTSQVKTPLGDLGKIPGETNRKRKHRPDPSNKEWQDDEKCCPPVFPSAAMLCHKRRPGNSSTRWQLPQHFLSPIEIRQPRILYRCDLSDDV
ncbi:hypothetical protein NPIL_679351 [Nephila pilipes]|uniref:Uncharacterized protein n=1 Tax=Nephila pilipes TaxID=299642 RepID=A0A8X6TKV3_NEPPI|nr:hypothetical protein NPIL_679351 [Nephila pilipes]